MTQYSSRTAEKFVVRMPDGMREQIAEQAQANRRSANSEIVSRLATSLDEDGAGTGGEAKPCSKQERDLLHAYRLLSPAKKKALLALLGRDK